MATPVVTPESTPGTSEHGHLISTDPTWRKTGVLPTSEPTKPAESAPAEPSDAAITAEPAAAPEAAKTQEPRPKRSDANTRIRELLAANRRLEGQLEESRRGKPTQAESSPAKAETEPAKTLQSPKKPDAKDFKHWEEYEAARDKYNEDLIAYNVEKAKADVRRELQENQLKQSLQQQLDEGRKRYADLDKVIKPLTDALSSPKSGIHQDVIGVINASPVLPDLLYVIGGNEADMQDFLQTAKNDPIAAIRKTVLLEQLVMEELSRPAGSKSPERQVARPPAPAKEVSGKTGPQPDPVASAAERSAASQGRPQDFGAYRRAANAADLARRRK